jgi:anti-sigma regulatory factor (Ser/Thr protein kinase)
MPAADFRQRFEPILASVRRARLLTRGLRSQLGESVENCLELVVSELAANAVLHARTPFEVSIALGSRVRVEVRDASPQPPVMQPFAIDAPSGRGLRLVDACADDWGCQVLADGKVVWAELLA